MITPAGGITPHRDVTTASSLGDVRTPDPAAESHKGVGCWRYPHNGPCRVGKKVRRAR